MVPLTSQSLMRIEFSLVSHCGHIWGSSLIIPKSSHSATNKKPQLNRRGLMWLRAELNHRHKDFQSFALPTELSGHRRLEDCIQIYSLKEATILLEEYSLQVLRNPLPKEINPFVHLTISLILYP